MLRWITIVTLLLICHAAVAQTPPPAYRDDFTQSQLGGGWLVLNENSANHSLSARSGFLRVLTERGALEENNEISNLIVREFSGDFVLEARVEFNPRAAQQFAGLLVYESQTNAAALGLTFVSGERGAFRGLALVSAALTSANVQPPVQRYDESIADDPNVVYLRLLRSGEQLVAGYSEDGATFTDFGSILNAFPDTVLVGIGATNGDFDTCGIDCDTSIPADFDYFQITPVDGGNEELEELTITGPSQVSGGETAEFQAIAHFSDDTMLDVTDAAQWTVAPPGNAEIDTGVLDVGLVPSARYITVVASYTHGSFGGDAKVAALLVEIVPAGSNGGLPRICGVGLLPLLPFLVLTLATARLRRGRFCDRLSGQPHELHCGSG